MKRIRLFILPALLHAGLTRAGGYAETNRMPLPIHTLMEAGGYGLPQNQLVRPESDTNSFRNLPLTGKERLITLTRPVPKPAWNFWNSASVKYVHRNKDPLNFVTPGTLIPYSALNQLEYDLMFSFDF